MVNHQNYFGEKGGMDEGTHVCGLGGWGGGGITTFFLVYILDKQKKVIF